MNFSPARRVSMICGRRAVVRLGSVAEFWGAGSGPNGLGRSWGVCGRRTSGAHVGRNVNQQGGRDDGSWMVASRSAHFLFGLRLWFFPSCPRVPKAERKAHVISHELSEPDYIDTYLARALRPVRPLISFARSARLPAGEMEENILPLLAGLLG